MSERKLELFFINIEVGLTATWEREAGDCKLSAGNRIVGKLRKLIYEKRIRIFCPFME